jgi:hypothetical protein
MVDKPKESVQKDVISLPKQNMRKGRRLISPEMQHQIVIHFVKTDSIKKTAEAFRVSPHTTNRVIRKHALFMAELKRIKRSVLADSFESIAQKATHEMERRISETPKSFTVFELNMVAGTAIDKMMKLRGEADVVVKFETTNSIPDAITKIMGELDGIVYSTSSEEVDKPIIALPKSTPT